MGLIIFGIIVLIIGILGAKSGAVGRFKTLIVGVGVILIIAGILTAGIRIIPPGHVGVQVLLGKVDKDFLPEGFHIVNPLINIEEMSIRTQNYTMSGLQDIGTKTGSDGIAVLSKDGLPVDIELTVLYRIVPSSAPDIYRQIGKDYEIVIIQPVTRARIRESAAYFNAESLYSEKRQEFQEMLNNQIEEEFKKRGIVLENVLVRNIDLPASVKKSIELKISAEQDKQRKKIEVEKEIQEAERKRAEAQGNADAQRIVSAALTDKVLQFEMIKVQKELANSPNAKIIIMGSSKGAPPFIIGN